MSRKIAGFALSSLDCFYFLFVLAALLPAVCQAKEFEYIDQGPAQGTCLNQNQKEGLNPGYLGECGDLRGMNLSGKILKTLLCNINITANTKIDSPSIILNVLFSLMLMSICRLRF